MKEKEDKTLAEQRAQEEEKKAMQEAGTTHCAYVD